jgi:hypothetical protein
MVGASVEKAAFREEGGAVATDALETIVGWLDNLK